MIFVLINYTRSNLSRHIVSYGDTYLNSAIEGEARKFGGVGIEARPGDGSLRVALWEFHSAVDEGLSKKENALIIIARIGYEILKGGYLALPWRRR